MKSILIGLLFWAAGSVSAEAQRNAADTTIQFKVYGVCNQCKHRIQQSLDVNGVRAASWNVTTKMLTVTYNPNLVSIDNLIDRVTATGHDTERKKAKDADYEALPSCCHYRDMLQGATGEVIAASQNVVMGVVLENVGGKLHPLAGASLSWVGTVKGTMTNPQGEFVLPKTGKADRLLISYADFVADTLAIGNMLDLEITLTRKEGMKGVVVTARPRTHFVDARSPFYVTVITKKELLRAACCNLGESFMTSPAVDVSFSDAVTGSRQIQLLGLAGIYTQLTVENMPGPRGLATSVGLNSIAGPWIESIQLIKGTGSVVNGYESIAGQINVELKKPVASERLYFNAYENSMGRTDLNLNWMHKLSDKWSSGFLLHDDFLKRKQDGNGDGFVDLPRGNTFSAVHRWQYISGTGWMSQFGVGAFLDTRTGGQVNFEPRADKLSTNAYGFGMDTKRYEAFGKLGYVFPGKPYKSFGLQVSATSHRQESYFGQTLYNGTERDFYANLIYQSHIHSDAHSIRGGFSFVSDMYNEQLNVSVFNRSEHVPGAFAEYSFRPNEKFELVTGLRADHDNLYGWFATPRVNARWTPWSGATLRASIGRGERTANIFAENSGLLASSRAIKILDAQAGRAYGLNPEIAWNKGISAEQRFKLFGREASLNLDFYRNDFVSQVVVDVENPGLLVFYNLQGRSYSNSFQAEINLLPVRSLELHLAYRYFDVQTAYGGALRQKPLDAKSRMFANVAYEVKSWKFVYTLNAVGPKRLPAAMGNSAADSVHSCSPAFVTMNAQISKALGKQHQFELYVGGENLTGYVQRQAIIAANDPFGPNFDASMVWGPLVGRMIYGGIRYTLK